MKYEYLLFNIIVISGPLFFGSLKKFYFISYWKEAFISITITAIPFIIWDIAVTNRHWFFSDQYTLGFRIFGLPFEEIMFFFTVPYACLFTWQMVKKYYGSNGQNKVIDLPIQIFIAITFIIFSFTSLLLDLEYTALSTLLFAISIIADKFLGANIFVLKKFWVYFIYVTFFTLIFNGYLTWQPIVTYDEIYQMGFRIFTIPIEDFLFGYALLIIATTIFEKRISGSLVGNNEL